MRREFKDRRFADPSLYWVLSKTADCSLGTQLEEARMIDNSAIYDSLVGSHPHICAFFHSADEEYRVLQSFITDGFERGEKAFHIVDPLLRAEHR